MTEPNATEQGVGQTSASPEPVSSSADDQAQVFSDAQLEQLEGIVNKRVQKTTDKRFQQTNNKISGITETLQKIEGIREQFGVSQEQAISIYERDEKIDAMLSNQDGGQEASPGSGEDMSVLAKSILVGAGADPADAAAVTFVNSLVGKDPGEFATELTKWAVERGQRPHATEGNVVATGGKTTSTTDAETLHAELARLRDLPMTPENMEARRKVAEGLRLLD